MAAPGMTSYATVTSDLGQGEPGRALADLLDTRNAMTRAVLGYAAPDQPAAG